MTLSYLLAALVAAFVATSWGFYSRFFLLETLGTGAVLLLLSMVLGDLRDADLLYQLGGRTIALLEVACFLFMCAAVVALMVELRKLRSLGTTLRDKLRTKFQNLI